MGISDTLYKYATPIAIVIVFIIGIIFFTSYYSSISQFKKSNFGIDTPDPFSVQGAKPPSGYDYITLTTAITPSELFTPPIDYNHLDTGSYASTPSFPAKTAGSIPIDISNIGSLPAGSSRFH